MVFIKWRALVNTRIALRRIRKLLPEKKVYKRRVNKSIKRFKKRKKFKNRRYSLNFRE